MLIGVLVGLLTGEIISGLIVGLLVGLLGVLFFRASNYSINMLTRSRWSWKLALDNLVKVGFPGGVILGLILEVIGRLIGKINGELGPGMLVGLRDRKRIRSVIASGNEDRWCNSIAGRSCDE